jgi:hypothetical protein
MVNSTLFADLVQAAGDVSVTNPRAVRNAAISKRHIWALTSRGKAFQQTIDGGPNITGRIQLKLKNSAQLYASGGTLTPTRANVLSTFTMPWMKMAVNAAWDDEEVVLNGSSIFTEDYVMAKYADMIDLIMGNAAVDLAEGVEGFLSALPVPGTMEGAAATAPMSLFTMVNDHFGTSAAVNGNFYSAATGAAFTTVMGINNTDSDKLRWRSQISGYDSTAAAPTTGKNILGALDEMFDQTDWHTPPAGAMHGNMNASWEESQWPNFVILCSMAGKSKLQQLARAQGDRWQDAGSNEMSKGPGGALGVPTFNGCEVIYAPFMDAGTYYLDSLTTASPAAVTEFSGAAAGGVGPRYIVLNLKDYHTTFHKEKYFQKTDTRQFEQQPFSNVIWYDTYFNFVNKARWSSGMVAPGTTAGQWPARVLTGASVYTS